MKKTLKEKIEFSLEKDPTRTDSRVAHNCNCKVEDVRKVREGLDLPEAPRRVSRKRGKRGKGKNIDEFRGKHDISLIIDRKCQELLGSGSQEYFDDRDFRSLCDVPVHAWRRVADSKQFAQFRLKRGEHNIWASPEVLGQIKKVLGLE
tara:strand:+ start:3857 stop:4300 length:444 start_codon:yes stop_codon:yes gene_type:complete